MRYNDVYKGVVQDAADPRKSGRVRCSCPQVMGAGAGSSKWLDWARVANPLGRPSTTSDSGAFLPLPVGTAVAIVFEEGKPDFPVVLGALVDLPSDNSGLPKIARGESDGTNGEDRTHRGVLVPAGTSGESEYGKNHVLKTPGGHIIEVDDTGGGRIRVRHRNGSFMELNSDGDLVKQVAADFLVYVGARVRVAAVQQVVLATAQVLLGSTSASGRIVREDSLMRAVNTHVHTVPPLGVVGAVPAGITPVATLPGSTSVGSVPLTSPADFYAVPRAE